jgi:P4 family phage/plasmid primase-like protien
MHDFLFVKNYRPQNLVEQRRADGFSPLLIDLDFQYSAEHAIRRRFDKNNIKKFVRMYVDTIKEFYDISELPTLRFFLCLRSQPYEKKGGATKKILKDGVHIECPDLALHADSQQIIRLAMLDQHAVNQCFAETDFTNTERDVYDESVIRKNGWVYYGDSKPDLPPYGLHAVWSYDTTTDKLTEKPVREYSNRQLMELFSIRYNVTPSSLEPRPETLDTYNQIKATLRVNHAPTAAATAPETITDGVVAAGGSATDAALREGMSAIDTSYREEEIALARRLTLECLSAERATDYMQWLEVGWCLHTIDPSDEGFQLWMDFSKMSPKYHPGVDAEHRSKWDANWGRHQGEHALRLGSLRLWAKEDNPAKYKEIVDENIVEYILRHVKGTHNHVARVMKKIYQDRYVTAYGKRSTDWYEFINNTWENIPQGVDVRNNISIDVAYYIGEAKQQVRRQWREQTEKRAGNTEDDFNTKIIEAKLKELKEAAGLFYVKDFIYKLDSNINLIGTANGVIDVYSPTTVVAEDGTKTVKYGVVHRQGKANDFVRHQMGHMTAPLLDPIPYVQYNPSDPVNAEIDDFFLKVFPRPDLRAYMWRLLSSHLRRKNEETGFYIWSGVGGNGKSVLVSLMRMVMGDYATPLKTTAVTRKKADSGAANPDLVVLENKAFIFLQEPDEGEMLNTAIIKQLSGGDPIEVRGLYEEQRSFVVGGKLHMMCNSLPNIKSMDHGTWRRIRVIKFEAEFKPPGHPEINPAKNIHPKDPTLETRIVNWREQFFARLVHVYQNEYLVHGMEPVPAIVSEASDKYRESFDAFSRFITERVRSNSSTVDAETPQMATWKAYQAWHAEYSPGPRLSQNEFFNAMTKRFGEPTGSNSKRVYRRLCVFYSDEEVTDFDNEDGAEEEA